MISDLLTKSFPSAPSPLTSSFFGAAYEEYARLGADAWERCLEAHLWYLEGQSHASLDLFEKCELRSQLSEASPSQKSVFDRKFN